MMAVEVKDSHTSTLSPVELSSGIGMPDAGPIVSKQEVIQLSENADSDLGPAGSSRIRAFLSDRSSLVAYRLPIDLSGFPSEGRKPRYQKVPALRTPVHQRCAVEGPPVANC